MLITQSPPSSVRPDTVQHRAPAQRQAASEGASKSSAVTLDLSESAIERAKEALRLAAERQASATDSQSIPQKLTAVEALDPERVHREELKALLKTHTGTQLYVIKRTLEALLGTSNETDIEAEQHEAEAKVRREAMHVVAAEPSTDVPKLEAPKVPVPIEHRSEPAPG